MELAALKASVLSDSYTVDKTSVDKMLSKQQENICVDKEDQYTQTDVTNPSVQSTAGAVKQDTVRTRLVSPSTGEEVVDNRLGSSVPNKNGDHVDVNSNSLTNGVCNKKINLHLTNGAVPPPPPPPPPSSPARISK